MKHAANAPGAPNKQIIYASVLPYTLVLYLVKAAIVTWYYTITPRTLPRCRLALHLISAACLAGFCLAVGLNGFSCYPVHRNWALDPASLCIASARPWAFFVSFGCHLATEILIFVYPFPLLRSIRTARARPRRWSIIFLFILGSLAIVATCARVIAIAIRYARPARIPRTVGMLTSPQCNRASRRRLDHHRVHRQHPCCLLPRPARADPVQEAGLPHPRHHGALAQEQPRLGRHLCLRQQQHRH